MWVLLSKDRRYWCVTAILRSLRLTAGCLHSQEHGEKDCRELSGCGGVEVEFSVLNKLLLECGFTA